MVCVFKQLYCSAQLSMSNTEKRYRNKIIMIIIVIKMLQGGILLSSLSA